MTFLKANQLLLCALFLIAAHFRTYGPDSSTKLLIVCPVNALSGDVAAGLPFAFDASTTNHIGSHLSEIPTAAQSDNTTINDGIKASEDIPVLVQTIDYVLQEFEVFAVKGISSEEAANMRSSALQLDHTLHQRVSAFTAYADLVFSRLQIATHAGGFDEQTKSYHKTMQLFNTNVHLYTELVSVRLKLLDLRVALDLIKSPVHQAVQGSERHGRGSLVRERNISRLALGTGHAVANSVHGAVGYGQSLAKG